MSILKVNEIRPQSGTTILIPSGHQLSLGGTLLTSNSLPPSQSGHGGKFLQSNGTNVIWENIGPVSIQTFTSSGTWTKGAGVTKILVRIVGGGGSGSGVGENGGAGGFAEKFIDVTGITSVSVQVGQGSTASTYYANTAGQGTSSSFGSFVTCTAGRGGNQSHQHCGGLPGLGSGGDLNIYGGGGSGHMYWSGPPGGSSFYGGGGATGHPQGGDYAYNHSSHAPFGAGGSAGYHTERRGGNGQNGVVVVYSFK